MINAGAVKDALIDVQVTLEVAERHGYNEVIVQREGDTYTIEVCGYVRDGETWRAQGGLPVFVSMPQRRSDAG